MNNLYKILHVSDTVSTEELKKAYRTLTKKYHPDVNPGDSQAEAQFKQINEAYDILRNPERRKEYDISQKRQSRQAPAQDVKRQTDVSKDSTMDFTQMHGNFAHFFGFNPKTGQVTNESQLRKRNNPLDAIDIFEQFIGLK